LDHAGAHPIGRRSDTGEPNLALLFHVSSASKHSAQETVASDQNRFKIPLTAESAAQFRDLAEAIERSPHPDDEVGITISCNPETGDLYDDLRRILTRDELEAKRGETGRQVLCLRGLEADALRGVQGALYNEALMPTPSFAV
jgi:hypothetical protein